MRLRPERPIVRWSTGHWSNARRGSAAVRAALLALGVLAAASPVASAARPARHHVARARPMATAASQAPAGPPALIVAISVDQYSADLFAQYRARYTHGLARLQRGAVFPQGFQSHAATETCPGHSTLLTGARPARTGIIANTWYDPASTRPDKRIYCAEDENDASGTEKDYIASPVHLLVPTLGERLKAVDRQSLNVAVSGKDRAALMMGGHVTDAAYWWNGKGFTSLARRAPSAAVLAENAAVARTLAAGAPALPAPPQCAASNRSVAVQDFAIGTGAFALAKNDADAFRISPRFDSAVGELALALVDEFKLGADAHPDVLSISFSANDYIGHAFGTQGAEMCSQQYALDATIGRVLDGLDRRGLDYVVVLTADHGGIDAVERLQEQAYPQAVRASAALGPVALGQQITAATAITSPGGQMVYGDGGGGDYYVARDIRPDQRVRAITALVAALKADPQIAAVFTATDLALVPPPGGSPQDFTLEQRARASFFAGRSGDVIALLKRGVSGVSAPRPGLTATHGSAWDYDRRVPMLFWRKGMTGFEQPAPVETVDIAPTLAALVGLKVPAGAFDGRCLDLDGGPGDTCKVTP